MIAGFTSDQIYERDFVYVMTDKHQSECTLKTAYKKLMIRNIKTSEVIVINRKLK